MRGPCEGPGEKEELEEGAAAAAGRPAGVPEAHKASDADSNSDQEKEGTHKLGELGKDTLYLRSCWAHSVVPASCFLHQGSTPELNLQHCGPSLPQAAQALASVLTSNPYIKRLELRDSGLCGAGTEALAGALSKSSICDVDLSENQLGAVGAWAVCAALAVNPAVQKAQLAGNGLEEQVAQYLAELLLAHTGLKPLDLSYNQLNDQAGEIWNHLRGPGTVAFARGLGVLDISYNGCGDPGASALGEGSRPTTCWRSGSPDLGLQVNQTLRIPAVSRNPMRSEGCFGVLRSVQANPLSALELLDFSDIHVNREFDDLTSSVKVILPGLYIKLPTEWSTKKNSCPSSDRLNDYVVWFPHLSHWPLQL
uniref:Leucine rich repeat containing 74B n=1 Tax=Monodon monoceros TaxID=40151 RepID=A0A8C6ARB6_MONMO